ncbi:hypothetical protein VP01_3941g1 [Puccinia sorghi]|uniref:Uncharacterized protein n=1 Tax=Puccinia sorghi TaxID=27349 RepID=A0A0L6USF1_9BASI|nr:hypothetical protein VP01_3941g1 [Puccinia sorghi]
METALLVNILRIKKCEFPHILDLRYEPLWRINDLVPLEPISYSQPQRYCESSGLGKKRNSWLALSYNSPPINPLLILSTIFYFILDDAVLLPLKSLNIRIGSSDLSEGFLLQGSSLRDFCWSGSALDMFQHRTMLYSAKHYVVVRYFIIFWDIPKLNTAQYIQPPGPINKQLMTGKLGHLHLLLYHISSLLQENYTTILLIQSSGSLPLFPLSSFLSFSSSHNYSLPPLFPILKSQPLKTIITPLQTTYPKKWTYVPSLVICSQHLYHTHPINFLCFWKSRTESMERSHQEIPKNTFLPFRCCITPGNAVDNQDDLELATKIKFYSIHKTISFFSFFLLKQNMKISLGFFVTYNFFPIIFFEKIIMDIGLLFLQFENYPRHCTAQSLILCSVSSPSKKKITLPNTRGMCHCRGVSICLVVSVLGVGCIKPLCDTSLNIIMSSSGLSNRTNPQLKNSQLHNGVSNMTKSTIKTIQLEFFN